MAMLVSPRFCTRHCLRFHGIFFLFLAYTAVLVREEHAFFSHSLNPGSTTGLPGFALCLSLQVSGSGQIEGQDSLGHVYQSQGLAWKVLFAACLRDCVLFMKVTGSHAEYSLRCRN